MMYAILSRTSAQSLATFLHAGLMLGAIEIARLAGRTTSTLKRLKTVSLYMYSIGGFSDGLEDFNCTIFVLWCSGGSVLPRVIWSSWAPGRREATVNAAFFFFFWGGGIER